MANAILLKPLVPAAISLGAGPAPVDFTTGAMPTGASITRAAGPYSYRDASGALVKGSTASAARFDYDPPVENLVTDSTQINYNSYGYSDGTTYVVTNNSPTAGVTKFVVGAVPANAYAIILQSFPDQVMRTHSLDIQGAVGGEILYLYAIDASNTVTARRIVLTTGWQRFDLPGNATSYAFGNRNLGAVGNEAVPAQTYYVRRRQINRGPVALAYAGTSGTAIYTPPVCRGVMLEPTRTNFYYGSEDLAGAATGGGITIAREFATAPDGTVTADRLAMTTGGNPLQANVQIGMANASLAITTSSFMRAATLPSIYLNQTNPGVVDYASAEIALTSSFVRYTNSVANSNAASNTYQVYNYRSGSTTSTDAVIWGGQLEIGATASSYIPTTTAAATRPAETLVLPAPGSSGTQDVLLTYSDGSTETRTGSVSNGYVSLAASSTPRVVARAQLVTSLSTVQVGALSNLLTDYAGIIVTLGGGNQASLIIDLGADTSIDTMMMFGVEMFPTNGTLTIDYATAAQGAFTGAYATDASGVPYAGSAAMTSGKGVSFWSLAAPVTARYVRLTYSAAGASLRASRLVIGKRIQLTRNFSFGAGFGVRDLGALDFSRRGVLLRQRGAKLRTVQLTFSNAYKDEVEATTKPLLEQLGNTEMVAVMTDPSVNAQRQNRSYFGPLVGDLGHTWRTAASWEAKLNVVSIF